MGEHRLLCGVWAGSAPRQANLARIIARLLIMAGMRTFALHVDADMQRKRENLYTLPRFECIYPAFIEN